MIDIKNWKIEKQLESSNENVIFLQWYMIRISPSDKYHEHRLYFEKRLDPDVLNFFENANNLSGQFTPDGRPLFFKSLSYS